MIAFAVLLAKAVLCDCVWLNGVALCLADAFTLAIVVVFCRLHSIYVRLDVYTFGGAATSKLLPLCTAFVFWHGSFNHARWIFGDRLEISANLHLVGTGGALPDHSSNNCYVYVWRVDCELSCTENKWRTHCRLLKPMFHWEPCSFKKTHKISRQQIVSRSSSSH